MKRPKEFHSHDAVARDEIEINVRPHLVCEILSSGTAQDDMPGGLKFAALEAHGVPYYWVIDPSEGWLDIYQHTNPYNGGDWEPGGSFKGIMRVLAGCNHCLIPPFHDKIDVFWLFLHMRGPPQQANVPAGEAPSS